MISRLSGHIRTDEANRKAFVSFRVALDYELKESCFKSSVERRLPGVFGSSAASFGRRFEFLQSDTFLFAEVTKVGNFVAA